MRRIRLSLRTVIVAQIIIALIACWFANRVYEQRHFIRETLTRVELSQRSECILYDYQVHAQYRNFYPPTSDE